ncbi:DNA internalization-related competence protein ComEC/Rec2 [Paenibacillus sp. CCS19]|uniref:DNA internalization-related competence protein ComEC/Rec2 n=1 Tax=Paenibacillus sp. CCS19 TaxID=3158387 RepID=UPI00255FEB23|nr:DNA internalization-related competence protein ComEC/Rec2 [Paenibacillus cellulosilyticus]GMK41373.1 DNA internalization-related competence protein ComEC/Rec2 [Paenibacillus cellulosilyticus]
MINRRLIVWLAICWALGIAVINQSAAIIGLCGVGLALMLAAAVMLKESTNRAALLCFVVFCAGGLWASWSDHRGATGLSDLLSEAESGYPPVTFDVEVEGTIVSAVSVDGDSVQFQLHASSIQLNKQSSPRVMNEVMQVQLKLLTEEEQQYAYTWRRGEHIHVNGELQRPAGPSNAGGFNYRAYLESTNHIYWLLRAKGADSAVVAPGSPYTAAAFLGRIDEIRDWLGDRMEELYTDDQAGYMKGLVLGSSDDLNPDVFRQFSALGLTHILAISGLHVAIFLYVVHALLRLARLARERSLLIMAALTPLYVLLSGASPSVVRAGLMAVIGLLAAYANRLKDGLHLLSASAILMLLWNPSYIHNVGFQLSYLVTAGLIVGVSPVRALLPRWRRGKALLDLVVVTLVAQLVSFPISIYYFNQWHPLSIPANFIFVPFISFIVMPVGAASLAIGPIWPLVGHWLAAAGQTMNGLTFMLVQYTAELHGWQTIWAQPPIWWIVLWYAALGIGFNAAGRWSGHDITKREPTLVNAAADAITMPLTGTDHMLAASRGRRPIAAFAAALMIIAALLASAWMPDAFDRTAQFSSLDIGQGDSLLIRTGSGKHVLVDGGGTVAFGSKKEAWQERRDPFEVGRKVLVPLLKQRGVHAIDLLVITHLDSDHIGGLQAVLESIPVRTIWWNGTVKKSDDAVKLMQTALELGIPMLEATAGMRWQPDKSASLDVLWPESSVEPLREVEDQNESSVTMMLTLYGRTFLLTGDIGVASERALLDRFKSSNACAAADEDSNQAWTALTRNSGGGCLDVLKVAHHGSRGSTSSEWLSYWHPSYAIISVGYNNLYRHPNAETLERLAEEGVAIWRTDRDGEIDFAVKPDGRMSIRWSQYKWKSGL